MLESTKNSILSFDERGRYMLLSRMMSDCKYYIAHPHEKHLWAGSAAEQIAAMRFIVDMFTSTDKPEWCSAGDIDMFESAMLEAASDIS